MTARYLSGTNGFIPMATGQVISYIRDPKSFKVNEYVQNIQSPAVVGVFAKLDRDAPARVVSDDEFAWHDGDERPHGRGNLMSFEWTEFRTQRRDFPFTLGNQAIEQAKGWKPLEAHAGMAAQQAMTARTKRIIDLLESTSNWGTHYADASTLNDGAGAWDTASSDPSSPNYNAIRKSLLEAAVRINKATNAMVQPDDLVLVISPTLATKMGQTSEIYDYLARSVFAYPAMEGKKPAVHEAWGVPAMYAGFKIVVEDAVRVSTRPEADADAGTRDYIKAATSAVLISRKGGLDGIYGAPSFSTVQCYFHKYELAVFTFEDARNERLDGHVTEHYKEILAAWPAGYLITGTM